MLDEVALKRRAKQELGFGEEQNAVLTGRVRRCRRERGSIGRCLKVG